MFTVALSTVVKIGKQLKCPLIDDWINRTSGVYTVCVEYYSAIKMNKILPFVTTWIYLEGIMLSEISMTEKYGNSLVYMWNLSKQNNRLIVQRTD